MEHISVLKSEVLEALDLHKNDVSVDATLGLGGHAKEILNLIAGGGRLIAFEQDERNLKEAKKRLETYKEQIIYIHDNFRYLKNRIIGQGIEEVDSVFFDLGLSSPHVDDADRGFSFMKNGPLDMRFDEREKLTAYEVVNKYNKERLVDIFFQYGDERMSKKIAQKICDRREEKAFDATVELADFIESFYPKKRSGKVSRSHPATKIFQAIRIEVNDEMTVLKEALKQAYEIVRIGGRIVVISYHSLEDRVVKQFFKKLERPPATEEQAIYQNFGDPLVKKMFRKPIIPKDEEIENNPRARSAKLRIYKKL